MQKLAVTTTVETTTEIKLTPKLRQMLLSRLEEHQQGTTLVREWKGTKKELGRFKRIEAEVADIFKKHKVGQALIDGTRIAGHGLKFVEGETSVFDKQGFMKEHGLSQADFDKFTTKKPKASYIRFSHPGEGSDDE